jgi:hypothetical protein
VIVAYRAFGSVLGLVGVMGLLLGVTFPDTISAHDLCQGVKMLVKMLVKMFADRRLAIDKNRGYGYSNSQYTVVICVLAILENGRLRPSK